MLFLIATLLLTCKKADDTPVRYCGEANLGSSTNKKRVLFIGLDGTRTDALQAANTPTIDSLAAAGLSHWNVDRGINTVSVPGWSTILHGVFPQKHGLTKNSFDGNNYAQYPDVLYYIRQAQPTWELYSISHWDDFLNITDGQNFCMGVNTEDELTSRALYYMQSHNPDVLLLHYDYPDHEGHNSGFSPNNPAYLKAIEDNDARINTLMKQIKFREANYNEQWMVVLCTDHGGEGTGHGGQDDLPQTRFVWFIVTGHGIAPAQLQGYHANTDLMPTMLKYVNVAVDSAWGLDGQPLY